MKIFKNILLIVVLAAGTLVACDNNDGPIEKTGEKIDKVGKDISDGAKDAADKVEEAVD